MSHPMPTDAPKLMRDMAEVVELRHVAQELLKEHALIAAPFACLCPTCRRASAWVPAPPATSLRRA